MKANQINSATYIHSSYLQTPVTPVKITSPQGTRHCAESPNHSIPNTQFEINEIMTSAPKNFTAK